MKLFSSLIVVIFALGFSAFAKNTNIDNRVKIIYNSTTILHAGSIHFEFELYDVTLKKKIEPSDLTESHTKLMHFITYDASRNEFNHVHPVFNNQKWSADFNLPYNGNYHFWAQGKLKDKTEFSTPLKAKVTSGMPAKKIVTLPDSRVAMSGLTKIELDQVVPKAGKMAMLNYTITRTDGSSPQITPYLGANAHIIAITPNGEEIIHTHPMDGMSADTGMIHTTFPTPGDYRIWIQLIDAGVVKTFPLSVVVKP